MKKEKEKRKEEGNGGLVSAHPEGKGEASGLSRTAGTDEGAKKKETPPRGEQKEEATPPVSQQTQATDTQEEEKMEEVVGVMGGEDVGDRVESGGDNFSGDGDSDNEDRVGEVAGGGREMDRGMEDVIGDREGFYSGGVGVSSREVTKSGSSVDREERSVEKMGEGSRTESGGVERRELSGAARGELERIEAEMEGKSLEAKEASDRYKIPTEGEIREEREMENEMRLREKWGDAYDRGGEGLKGEDLRLFKRDMREADRRVRDKEIKREAEVRRDEIYKMLDPNYQSERDYRREQNIKAIIAGIGDIGSMIGKAGMAAHGGVVMPFRSMTNGVMEDRRISDAQRRAVKGALEQMRKGEMLRPIAELSGLRKERMDLLKSGSSYDKVTGKEERTVRERETEVGKNMREDDYGWKTREGGNIGRIGGSAGGGLGKLGNNEVTLPGPYDKNGFPVSQYRMSLSNAIPALNRLFDIFSEASGVKVSKNGDNVSGGGEKEREIGEVWATLLKVANDVEAGNTNSMDKLRQQMNNYFNAMRSYFGGEDVGEEYVRAYRDYENGLRNMYGVEEYGGGEAYYPGLTQGFYPNSTDEKMEEEKEEDDAYASVESLY